ncbi:centromere protein L [Hyperolius riggenbachi]|uniref:centromere protein L n=1 Tax=Hyperolius riggenbachi TaxID=752182 RepID=UPI0035A2BC96
MQTPSDGGSPRSKSSLRNPLGSLTASRRRSQRRTSRRTVPQDTLVQETLDPQKAAFLLQKQWNLYSVTPLYNFSYNKLKDYANHLSAHIAAEKQKGLAFEVGTDLTLKATFSPLPGLKGRAKDPAAVLIQVVTKYPTSKKDPKERIVWTGWFCAPYLEDYVADIIPDTFVCLPLFLVNGGEQLTAMVGSWLQRSFDCCFGKLLITSHELTWLAAMWTGYEVQEHMPATELVFSVPVEPPMTISYTIHAQDFKTLWSDIHKCTGEVTLEEVEQLFQCLYSHFFRHFKIHLSATQLVKVTATVASAHCEGKVKFLNRDHLIQVLGYLTEIAMNNVQY